jgi:dephospho-CoA kinase
MNTTIINLYGGPGCGKSTLATEVFAAFKKGGAPVVGGVEDVLQAVHEALPRAPWFRAGMAA